MLIGANRSSVFDFTVRFESVGSVAPCRSGLKVDMLEDSPGRCDDDRMSFSLGVCGRLSPVSLYPLVSPSRSSSASSRISPKIRRTMLPTTISLGCAAQSRWPTLCTRSMSFATSVTRWVVTTRRSRYAVAMAHGLEWRICLRFNNLIKLS